MENKNEDSWWIEWNGPDGTWDTQYLAVSKQSGMYWTDDTQDPNIVDGSKLEIKDTIEDTLKQIGEKWRLKKGRAFERKNLFKHPYEHAWLCVENVSTGRRNEEDGKIIREYQAYYSRKFKNLKAISKITGKRQGNVKFQDKEYVRQSSLKAKAERKKRLENIERASKRLNFNPAEQLIAWAQGDEDKLNTTQPITNAQRIKCLEILASYAWAKPKPVDYSALELQKQRGNQGPVVHVTLPSNSRELEKHVLTHDSKESLDNYFKSAYKEPDEVAQLDEEAGEYDEETGMFLPDNGR